MVCCWEVPNRGRFACFCIHIAFCCQMNCQSQNNMQASASNEVNPCFVDMRMRVHDVYKEIVFQRKVMCLRVGLDRSGHGGQLHMVWAWKVSDWCGSHCGGQLYMVFCWEVPNRGRSVCSCIHEPFCCWNICHKKQCRSFVHGVLLGSTKPGHVVCSCIHVPYCCPIIIKCNSVWQIYVVVDIQ